MEEEAGIPVDEHPVCKTERCTTPDIVVSVSLSSSSPLTITGVSATTGPIGTQLWVSGSGFGATQGSSLVVLKGIPTTVNFWSDTSISITMPSGAISGYLVVSVAPGMNDSNPVEFTVSSTPLPASLAGRRRRSTKSLRECDLRKRNLYAEWFRPGDWGKFNRWLSLRVATAQRIRRCPGRQPAG
jgi:hypothetical protein